MRDSDRKPRIQKPQHLSIIMPKHTVALAGNAFVTSSNVGADEIIDDNGLANWSSADTVLSVYFCMDSGDSVKVDLVAHLTDGQESSITVTINGAQFPVTLAGARPKTYPVGEVNVSDPGYVKVDLQGVAKNGECFGYVSGLRVTTTSRLKYANDPDSYYWSRRGPSVHMNYAVPANSEYFYNEVTAPTNEDALGSYFMVAGFSAGYFGMQVRENDRCVLFSVWDADNGEKTTLVNHGAGVTAGRFDGEGAGGQAFLVFNWSADTTYRFITRVHHEDRIDHGEQLADNPGSTLYSAWFSSQDSWRYIATWRRPSDSTTFQSGVYSFLENFLDKQGHIGRRVEYGNQWVRDVDGTWSEITTAHYTGDNTARNEQRIDFAGGVENGHFYLRNCGFFSDYVPLDQDFSRTPTVQSPAIDVDTLPMQ